MLADGKTNGPKTTEMLSLPRGPGAGNPTPHILLLQINMTPPILLFLLFVNEPPGAEEPGMDEAFETARKAPNNFLSGGDAFETARKARPRPRTVNRGQAPHMLLFVSVGATPHPSLVPWHGAHGRHGRDVLLIRRRRPRQCHIAMVVGYGGGECFFRDGVGEKFG